MLDSAELRCALFGVLQISTPRAFSTATWSAEVFSGTVAITLYPAEQSGQKIQMVRSLFVVARKILRDRSKDLLEPPMWPG